VEAWQNCDASVTGTTFNHTLFAQTAAAKATLAQGKNNLRFNRLEGSRGMSIKECTLTPIR
jgi:hypothetical protein